MFPPVLFDLDGTLLDTLEDIAASMNRALAALGLPIHPPDDYRFMVGDGVGTLMERALPLERRDAGTIAQCRANYMADYAENWKVRTRMYDGIPEMLDALTDRGCPLAVLSKKPHRFTSDCVQHFLGRWRFAALLGQSDQLPRKPDPAGAIEIARRLKRRAEEFVYLGDTATDMNTARAASMHPVGAVWGFRSRDELVAAGGAIGGERPQGLLHGVG